MSDGRVDDFEKVFNASPNPYVLLDREFTIVAANDAYLRVTGRRREDILDRGMFEAFPGGPHDPGGTGVGQLHASLERVVREAAPDTIALIRYAIARETASGTVFDERFWSAVHTPLLDQNGEVTFILQHTVDVTELQRLKSIARENQPAADDAVDPARLEIDLFRRAQEVQAENRMLDAERRHLRQLFDQAPGFVAILAGSEHIFELINAAYADLVGRKEIVGRTLRDALPEVEGQGFLDLLDGVYRSGEAFVGSDMRVKLRRGEADQLEERYVDFVFQPIVEADGSISGIFIQGIDITERKRAEEQKLLLVDELNHRVKNALATVQSIVGQTARGAPSIQAFRDDLQERLAALSRTHDALTRGRWLAASLREIVEQELEPYAGAQADISGPDVALSSKTALTLGMALHELATNAAKYGALSAPEGRLAVAWHVDRDDHGGPGVTIEWVESGGPVVTPPTRRGFGSTLIQRSVAHDLGGQAKLDFDPAGLHCRFFVPLREE